MSDNKDKKGMIYFIIPNRIDKREQDSALSFIERSRKELAEKPKTSTLTIKYSLEETIQAAEMGISEAQYSIGLYYYNSPGPASDMKKSIAWLTKAAEQGHLKAMLYLGEIYECGYCDKIDLKKARKWYQKAAEQGNEYGQLHMARYYHNGEAGLKKSPQKAFKWNLKAAEQGNCLAMSGIASSYANGNGVEQDYEKAFEWYLKIAYQGGAINEFYITTLGDYYRLGLGVEKNIDKAKYWYYKLARRKYEGKAQCSMGFTYLIGGKSFKKNIKKAVKWFTKAADNSSDFAICFLLYIQEYGEEAGYDLEKFKNWLFERAEKGLKDAQGALSDSYDCGYVTPMDEVKYEEWFEKAYRAVLDNFDKQIKSEDVYMIEDDMPAFEKAYYMRKAKEREELRINT